jgi:hypothetical protein
LETMEVGDDARVPPVGESGRRHSCGLLGLRLRVGPLA